MSSSARSVIDQIIKVDGSEVIPFLSTKKGFERVDYRSSKSASRHLSRNPFPFWGLDIVGTFSRCIFVARCSFGGRKRV